MISKRYNAQMGNYLAKLAKEQNNLGTWQESIMYNTKQTNADRIRSMTDEELAELMEDKGDCPPIECPHDGEGAKVTRLDCKACWLDWLKEEANT